VDRKQIRSSTVKGNLKIIGIEHTSTNSEVIEKVLMCPAHPNFYLKKVSPPFPGQITFDRKSLKFIKKALGTRQKDAPSTILEGDCIYYNMYYTNVMRFTTFARRLWRKEFSARFPLDSLVLLVSSTVHEKHFTLFGTYNSDMERYVIVNIIRS
jgi:hypothetical protein